MAQIELTDLRNGNSDEEESLIEKESESDFEEDSYEDDNVWEDLKSAFVKSRFTGPLAALICSVIAYYISTSPYYSSDDSLFEDRLMPMEQLASLIVIWFFTCETLFHFD